LAARYKTEDRPRLDRHSWKQYAKLSIRKKKVKKIVWENRKYRLCPLFFSRIFAAKGGIIDSLSN
jgi:hypothetical protein